MNRENENLLDKINLPSEEIINKINLCAELIHELCEKYSIKNKGKSFFRLSMCSSCGLYNAGFYSDHCRKIDGIYKIEEGYRCYIVKGYYNTDSEVVVYDHSVNINGMEYAPSPRIEVDWRIVEGQFKKDVNIYIPKYLFDLSLEKVYEKMEEEFKEDFKERYNEEIEHWNEVIKAAEEMIIKVNKVFAGIMEKQ